MKKMLIKMKIIKRTTQIFILFSIVGFQIQAQEVLTIEDIKIALENNYDIKAKNDLRVDETNVSSAGML
jgi:hypothetical protein